jgi:hypothetical protein
LVFGAKIAALAFSAERWRKKDKKMKVKEYERDGISITEKFYSYQECEQIYGSSNIGVLNPRFEAEAQRATDGNASKYVMYGHGGITIVTEC